MKQLRIRIPGKIIEIPYLVIKGKEKGRRCILSGGMHGDEVNGIALVQRFLEYARKHKLEKELKGEIVVFPILNLSGFEKHVRQIAYDKKDLNRSFNRKDKTASNFMANSLERHFYSKADIAIDCHDSGERNMLIPHTRVHKHESHLCTECTHQMARAFGSKIIVERKGKAGMLAVEMSRKHTLPVLTIEIGGALKVAHDFLHQGLEGIINILRQQDFFPGEVTYPRKQYYLHNRYGVPSKYTGLLKFNKKLGHRVHRGDKIGTIYVPEKARQEDLTSPMCGLLFSIQHADSIVAGETMYSILEDKKCHTKRLRTARMFEEIKNIHM
jgi:uncharacterized protein